MKVNPNLSFLNKNKNTAKYLLLQGGTRSGKTYAVLQFIIRTCMQLKDAGAIFSICRETMPALKATAMRDFFELLNSIGEYSEDRHSKSDNYYRLNGNMIEFINLDDEQKVRGRKRNFLYINEANEARHPVVRQLLFRTTGLCVFDYNPSITEEHWLIDDILKRDNAKRIITTYLDNPYLSASQVEEIEYLKKVNPELWKVFGMGEIGEGLKGLVFTDWQIGTYEGKAKVAFGLDFGYSPDPLALIEVAIQGNSLYLKEHLYRQKMEVDDMQRIIPEIIPRGVEVFCDHRQELINMLFRKNVNAKQATKGKDSIDTGIKTIQKFTIFVHPDSHNLKRELKSYRYKEDKDGNPIGGKYSDSMNHLIDALRYAVTGMVHVPARGFASFVTKL